MVSGLSSGFEEEYKKLNKEQREAVEALDGPVMVVAGPGTGKTQILALRIANILKKTDVKADGILCLTFTNSAVAAMRERLERYIGEEGSKVNVYTFHSFGMKLIGEYYKTLNFPSAPELLEGSAASLFFEELLRENDWQYLSPRSDRGRYFEDLRSLISRLKREGVTAEECRKAVALELGGTKDKRKIESWERFQEAVGFWELYERAKNEKSVIDYDDVLENLVQLARNRDVRADILENFLYVLVDEHQDSNALQNEFLKSVWGKEERPNIFVVGDDRQLIYGFSGASLAYFQDFHKTFPDAKVIGLLVNYRSTRLILELAQALLPSKLSPGKLLAQSGESFPIRLWECENPRDEIVTAALAIESTAVDPANCAILVPKNRQVRSAIGILQEMQLPVAIDGTLSLFSFPEAESLLRVLRAIIDPEDKVLLALTFLDPASGIDPTSAHKFFSSTDMRNFTLLEGGGEGKAGEWQENLASWSSLAKDADAVAVLEKVGKEITGVRITEAFLCLLKSEREKNPEITLPEFVARLSRMQAEGEDVELPASFSEEGVRILTLHRAKGLEFSLVWIAHMDERSLTSSRRRAFLAPPSIEEKIERVDEEAKKRELYVAITRAKKFCNISWATSSALGTEQELAQIVAELPENLLKKEKRSAETRTIKHRGKEDIAELVGKEYTKRNVSVSLLNNFFECVWKWYFVNLLKFPEPRSETLEFGGTVHEALDRVLKNRANFQEKDLDGIVSAVVEGRNFWSGKGFERAKKDASEILKRWVKERLPRISEKFRNEVGLSGKLPDFPHLKLYGKIDLIEELPEGLRVVDFKTGSPKRKSEIEKIDEEGRRSTHLRQLAMYGYLVGKSEHPIFGRLEFLEGKDSDYYEREISEEDIRLLMKDISDYDQAVRSGNWITMECHYNSYGRNEPCPYCRLGEVFQT